MPVTVKCSTSGWSVRSYFSLTDKLINSMEQSPSWESNRHSDSQEIHSLLWNPKVHYRVHEGGSLVTVLNQMNPVHAFPPYFPKIHSTFILTSVLRSSEWSLPFNFSNQNSVWISRLTHACYMPPSISSSLIWSSSSLCNFSSLTPLLGQSIPLTILFSNTVSVFKSRSSGLWRHVVPHPRRPRLESSSSWKHQISHLQFTCMFFP